MHESTATRRGLLAAGGTAAAGLLAGCTDATGSSSPTPGGVGSYSVSMAPVGEVTLEGVPASVAQYFPGYADMQVALGHGDAINSIGVRSRYHTSYYDELDGVSVDEGSMTELVGKNGIDKEVFLQLDSDLHLVDPRWLTNNGFFGLDENDVDRIAEQVAPWLGNTVFRRTDAWHDYRYYSLYGAFEKVAVAFKEGDRFDRFEAFHDDLLARVQADLPPAKERPNALLCYAASNEPEEFSPYRVSGKGTNKKMFHDLGIADALRGTGVQGLSTTDRGKIDYETMLEVDPDSILIRGHETQTAAEFRNTVLAYMEQHDTASELTAVQNGAVYRGGPIYLGPIQHLFLLERFANDFFPDTYDGELFDRGELADIVAG